MTGQYSNNSPAKTLRDRIFWLMNEIKNEELSGEVTLRFINGKMSKVVTVTRKEVLK